MPMTAWDDPIRYKKCDEESYMLDTITEGFAGMIYSYFSADPSAGVHRFPF